MKKMLLWTLVFSLLLSGASALAAEASPEPSAIIPTPTPFVWNSGDSTRNVSDQYSDAPANPTQENVLEIRATALSAYEEAEPFMLMKMLPTGLTVDNLSPIFDFVEINKRPPARYFPEYLQQQIIDIGFDPDALFMPEFMSLFPQVYPNALEKQTHVKAEVLFDIDYEIGRPVVVVLGWDSDEGIQWQALPAHVPEADCIHFTVPPETLKIINGQETLFAVLTVKPGSGYELYMSEEIKIPYEIPSITSGDVTVIVDGYSVTVDGEPIPCELILVEKNRRIALELDAIDRHINEKHENVMSYFKSEMNRQVHLMLPEDVANDDLLAYEVACVQSVEYIEPYGDVMARFLFATPYYEGQPMVSMLALPDPEDREDEMIWTPLHTEVERVYLDNDHFIDYVEITFSSEVLTPMLEETALLVVLSTPMPD